MKFKIKFTKKSLADHFKYYAWIYVAAIVISTSFFNISTTMIRNQAPPDQKLYSFVCGDAIALDYFITFHAEMTQAFPHLKVVACDNLAYNSMSTMAKEQKEKFLSLISNKYGDVLVIPYNEFADLAKEGAFEPLEDDFQQYLDDVDPISLKTVTMKLQLDETKEPETHVYGIPLSHLEFFPYYYDTNDKVIVLTSFSQNKDNARSLIKWYLDYMIETEWYGTLN